MPNTVEKQTPPNNEGTLGKDDPDIIDFVCYICYARFSSYSGLQNHVNLTGHGGLA